MKVDVLTLFPAMFAGPLDESILRRARESGRLELALHDLRDWTQSTTKKEISCSHAALNTSSLIWISS